MGVTPCPSPRALRKPGSRKRTKHLARRALHLVVGVIKFVVVVTPPPPTHLVVLG